MKNVEILTTRQKLAAGALGVIGMLIVIAFIVALTSCATGPDIRPYHGGAVELTSEQLGWAAPAMPRASMGFSPPAGSIDMGATPTQIRIGVRNGRSYALRFTLVCGETGHSSYRVVTIVDAEQERGLYFSMPRRIGLPQAFVCTIDSMSSRLE